MQVPPPAPALRLYFAKGQNTGAAVVVFPGGGYCILAIEHEGSEVCDRRTSAGVNCVLLKYRVPETGPYPKDFAALSGAQRALGLVRLHAAEWKIAPKRVGVLGFSAGGHLAVALRTHNQQRVYNPIDAADTLNCRPDSTVLVYPDCLSIPGQNLMANKDLLPTAQTPPIFLVQAENDPYVESAIASYSALRSANVPAELHPYAEGGHGFELRQTALPVAGWPGSVEAWLKTIGILKTPEKCRLRTQTFLRIGGTNTCYGDQDEPESQRTS